MAEPERIRLMRLAHVHQVVQVHLQSFPGFFLTYLGERFLRELYTAILQDPSGIAFVYQEGGLLGFVAGTDQPAGFYKRLLSRRLVPFGLASLGPALRQPHIIPRLLRAQNTPTEADPGEGCGTLMSIAVTPSAQGRGVGGQLLQAFLEEAKGRGLAEVNLTTDRLDNEEVNQFYQRHGFRLTRAFSTPEGRAMNEYRYRL